MRIQIEEIGGEDDSQRRTAIEKVQKSQSEAKKHITSQDNKMFEKFTKTDHSTSDNSSGKSDKKLSEPSKRVKSSSKNKDVVGLGLQTVANGVPEESKSVSPRSLQVPQSSFQFQTDYKVLKNDLESFYYYVKVSIRL